MESHDVVLLTINWNSRNALEMTLKSYAHWHFKEKPLPICIIDNGSEDDSIDWMKKNDIPYISLPKNIGHMKAVNYALEQIRDNFQWVFLVDCDLRFDENVLSKCSGEKLVYANLQRLFLGRVNFQKKIPDSWLNIATSMSGQWWVKRLQPARCLMKWSDLKKLGLKDFHPKDDDAEFFDLHADPGCYFFSELERLGVEFDPFPEGTFHYELSSFRGDGTYPDRQREIKETIPKDLEPYKNVELIGRFCHFSKALS